VEYLEISFWNQYTGQQVILGSVNKAGTLSVSWNGAFAGTVALRGAVPGRVALPPSPPGRVVLRLVADAPPGGTVVLDRVRVDR